MDRRQFLALSTVGFASAAGCAGGEKTSDNSSTTNPEATASGHGSAASLGETVTTENGIAITTTDAQLVNEVMTPDGKLVPERSDNRLALVNIEAKNTADEPKDLPGYGEIVLVTGGKQFSAEVDFGLSADSYTRLSEPVSGPFYDGVSDARPSVTASGWLLFEVPSNTKSGRLSWSREALVGDEFSTISAEWTLQFDPSKLSNVQVIGIDAPDTALHHAEINVVVELENTGGSDGVFEGRITSESLAEPISVKQAVPSGDRTTVSVTLPYPSTWNNEGKDREVTYQIAGETFSVTYQNPTLELGESVQTPWGLVMEVIDSRQIEYFETKSAFGDWVSREPDSGEMFIASKVSIGNQSDSSINGVSAGEFEIVSETSRVDSSLAISALDTHQIRGPVSGQTLRSQDPLPPGGSHTGWVILTVRTDLPENTFLRYAPAVSDYQQFHPQWQV